MRIAIDLDGTICEIRHDPQTYADVAPLPGAVDRLRQLKVAGHYLIILTARHMQTCQGNEGAVIARVGKITLDWLAKHDVPYDEIHFGKPNAEVYIDDRALRFTDWTHMDDDALANAARSK